MTSQHFPKSPPGTSRRHIPGLVLALYLVNAIHLDLVNAAVSLTAYGEPCTDACTQRGFPYTWCHKEPSRNGTWIDRDYCSAVPGITRYQEPCSGPCSRHDNTPFYWCKTRATSRGDWDYCSPGSLEHGTACAWSTWGGWSGCSATCGSRSTRTRRRRMEHADGRVRHCSGEIEQSIRSCRMPECPQGRTRTLFWGCFM